MGKTKNIPAFFKTQGFITLLIFAALLIITTVIQGNFWQPSTLRNTIISWTPLILLTMGQAIVIIAGGLDMSAGASFSFMVCLMARIMKADDPATGVTALIVCAIFVVVIGVLNGVSVGVFKLPPLIATFATSYIWLGAALVIMPTPGGECVNWMRLFYRFSSWDNAPAALAKFGEYVPTGALLIIAAVVIWYFVYRSKTGRYIYAVGSNRNVAYSSGINTAMIQIKAYLLNALFIMFAALFLVGQNQSGSARVGDPYTLEAIAAAAVGGIALAGGSGNVFIAIAGTAIINLVSKIIFFSGISTDYQTIVSGLILLVAISASSIIAVIKKQKNKKEVEE